MPVVQESIRPRGLQAIQKLQRAGYRDQKEQDEHKAEVEEMKEKLQPQRDNNSKHGGHDESVKAGVISKSMQN